MCRPPWRRMNRSRACWPVLYQYTMVNRPATNATARRPMTARLTSVLDVTSWVVSMLPGWAPTSDSAIWAITTPASSNTEATTIDAAMTDLEVDVRTVFQSWARWCTEQA